MGIILDYLVGLMISSPLSPPSLHLYPPLPPSSVSSLSYPVGLLSYAWICTQKLLSTVLVGSYEMWWINRA